MPDVDHSGVLASVQPVIFILLHTMCDCTELLFVKQSSSFPCRHHHNVPLKVTIMNAPITFLITLRGDEHPVSAGAEQPLVPEPCTPQQPRLSLGPPLVSKRPLLYITDRGRTGVLQGTHPCPLGLTEAVSWALDLHHLG